MRTEHTRSTNWALGAAAVGSTRGQRRLVRVVRLLVAVAFAAALAGVLVMTPRPRTPTLQLGQIAPGSIFAPFSYTVEGDVDVERTGALQREAMAALRNVFDVDPGVAAAAEEDLRAFFTEVRDVVKTEGLLGSEAEEAVSRGTSADLGARDIQTFLATEDLAHVEEWARTWVQDVMTEGLLDLDWKERLRDSGVTEVVVRNVEGAREGILVVEEVATPREAERTLNEAVRTAFSRNRRLRGALAELVRDTLRPNLVYNATETRMRREAALAAVTPVRRTLEVQEGERVVSRGERITAQHLLLLGPLTTVPEDRPAPRVIVGRGVLALLFVACVVAYLNQVEGSRATTVRELLLVAAVVLPTAAAVRLMAVLDWPVALVPIAAGAMLLGLLIEPQLPVLATGGMGVLAGIAAGGSVEVVVTGLVTGVVAIAAVRGARQRVHLLQAGSAVVLLNGVLWMALSLGRAAPVREALTAGGWGALSGVLATVLVTVLLPLLEQAFQMTTNISLLELSDQHHPVLVELSRKAPGTSQQGLLVGNLAARACEEIGANALLARVGSYYQDIGKIVASESFPENQRHRVREEPLAPLMGARLQINHVKDGIELARRHRLPQRIVDFIAEHQGTGRVSPFYERAAETARRGGESLDERPFRYPGPKPRSRETAVALLADAVAVAYRSLANPMPASLRGMVHRVINAQFIDKQLDQCRLTLRELEVIRESFVRVLTELSRTEVVYPGAEEADDADRGQGRPAAVGAEPPLDPRDDGDRARP